MWGRSPDLRGGLQPASAGSNRRSEAGSGDPAAGLETCPTQQQKTSESSSTGNQGVQRLDHYLKQQFPNESRALLQQWIRNGNVLVNGAPSTASRKVRSADRVDVQPAPRPPLKAHAEDLPLEILYEDSSVIAVNKPSGMVVHAGAGVREGTLVNALLFRFEQLSSAGGELRPGIVHRLDRFTSGVILVARNDAAHRHLAAQFSGRKVEKTYLALVHGVVKRDTGRIDKPIARDPSNRARMTSRLASGRAAWSEFRVLRRFPAFTYLEVKIGTGRTHQIRVHLASIGHPVVGDRLYGAPASAAERYFLHAQRIRFVSPATGQPVIVEAPVPIDLETWMQGLL